MGTPRQPSLYQINTRARQGNSKDEGGLEEV